MITPEDLYNQFIAETAPKAARLPWEELPQYVRDAWGNVIKTIRQDFVRQFNSPDSIVVQHEV
jgi:hypothetical protein